MHPVNKYERYEIGKKKGKRRTKEFFGPMKHMDEVKKRELIQESEHIRRDTTKVCSCYGCGNPRKFFEEITMQERRAADSHLESDLLESLSGFDRET